MQQPQEIHDEEHEQPVARVAAIDVAKASGIVCTRVPHASTQARRVTKVWEVEATTGAIIELGGHLAGLGSSRSRWSPPRTTCDMRVHECKWEAPMEVRPMTLEV
jgi:hypothetical protein